MLCSHIMQYTCFTPFNYVRQTMWRACLSVPESPVMFNACPGVAERPARPRCRLDLVLTPAGPDVFQCTSNGHSGCRLRQVWTRKVLGCFLIFFACVELRIFFLFSRKYAGHKLPYSHTENPTRSVLGRLLVSV